jgi:hypothetical protein
MDDKMQPVGKLLETAGGWRVGCEVYGWSNEASAKSPGQNLDDLLDHDCKSLESPSMRVPLLGLITIS